MLFKFTNGRTMVQFVADSYTMACEMVPVGYTLFSIDKIVKP